MLNRKPGMTRKRASHLMSLAYPRVAETRQERRRHTEARRMHQLIPRLVERVATLRNWSPFPTSGRPNSPKVACTRPDRRRRRRTRPRCPPRGKKHRPNKDIEPSASQVELDQAAIRKPCEWAANGFGQQSTGRSWGGCPANRGPSGRERRTPYRIRSDNGSEAIREALAERFRGAGRKACEGIDSEEQTEESEYLQVKTPYAVLLLHSLLSVPFRRFFHILGADPSGGGETRGKRPDRSVFHAPARRVPGARGHRVGGRCARSGRGLARSTNPHHEWHEYHGCGKGPDFTPFVPFVRFVVPFWSATEPLVFETVARIPASWPVAPRSTAACTRDRESISSASLSPARARSDPDPDPTGPDRTGPDRTGPDRTGPGQAESLTDFRSRLDVPPGPYSGPVPMRQTQGFQGMSRLQDLTLAGSIGSRPDSAPSSPQSCRASAPQNRHLRYR